MDPEIVPTHRVEHAVYHALDLPRREPAAPRAQEHRPTVGRGARTDRFPEVKIAAQRQHRARADRNDPLLAPLAAHLGLIRQQVQVVKIHPAELAQPDAGGVEELQDRKIPGRLVLVARRARLGPGEQPLGLLPVEVGRESLVDARHPRRACHRIGDVVVHLEIAVEASYRRETPRSRALGEASPLQLAQKAAEPETVHRGPAPAPPVVSVAELDERFQIAAVGFHRMWAGPLLFLEMEEIVGYLRRLRAGHAPLSRWLIPGAPPSTHGSRAAPARPTGSSSRLSSPSRGADRVIQSWRSSAGSAADRRPGGTGTARPASW